MLAFEAAAYLIIGLFLLISFGLTILWIVTLVNAAQTAQWIWFVLMLVLGPVISLVYLAAAYDSGPKARHYQRRTRLAGARVESDYRSRRGRSRRLR